MRTITRVGLFTGVFLLGCAASRVVIPPATAAGSQKWDYACFNENDEEDITATAKKAGHQGWELVAATGGGTGKIWCFKRPL